jgi:hypothetical protein
MGWIPWSAAPDIEITRKAWSNTLKLNTYKAKLAVSIHSPNNLNTHRSPSCNAECSEESEDRQGVVRSEKRTPVSDAICSRVIGMYVAVCQQNLRGYTERYDSVDFRSETVAVPR